MSNRGTGVQYSFHREGIGKSLIDHIFISAKSIPNVLSCGVISEDPLNVSDHLPLQICMGNRSSTVDERPVEDSLNVGKNKKIKWHKMSAEDIDSKYTAVINQEFERLHVEYTNIEYSKIDVDKIVDMITNAIVKISNSNLTSNKCKKSNAKPFWCEELSQKLLARKESYERWKSAGKPNQCNNPLLVRLKEAKRDFRRAYRKCEAMFRAKIEEKIDDCQELDQKEFWYLLKKDKKPNKQGHILKDQHGNIISDMSEVNRMWKDHFSKLGQPSVNDNYDDAFNEFVNMRLDEFCSSLDEMAENVLEEPISVEEVKCVCKLLKCGKAQDFTSIQYEHLKYAGDHVYSVLAYLFNAIVFKEKLPTVFKKGITLALFKGGDKDPLDQNNFRGITIQSVLCKIYESVLVNRSSSVIKEKVKIVETQSACSKGLSSIHASLLLQETIAHNVDTGNNSFVTYFDTRKAFDTVWIQGLLYLLFINGIRGKLWRMIRLSYLEYFTAVCINGQLSTWFKLLQGVKQGAVLSMLLYICFINGLLTEIMESVVGAKVLDLPTSAIGYADDLAIVTTNRVAMQQLIDIAYRYSCKWRFDFSPSKCAVMIFGKNTPQCTFHLGPTNLSIVPQYTHVGVTLVSKGKIALTDIKKRLQACKRTFFALIGNNLYKTSLSPIALSKIYWSVCVPKFLSGGEVKCFSSQEYEEFDKFHKSMARDIQNLPGNTPDPMVLASLGWRDIVSQVDYVKLMFIQRILNLRPTSIYRTMFLRRLFFIMVSGIMNSISPIAQIVRILLKYNLLEQVVILVKDGTVPSKSEWKRVVSKAIEDKIHSEWRFLLSLYPKLEIYRSVVNKYSFLCWWEMAKSLPF